jgi:hypothetical protein
VGEGEGFVVARRLARSDLLRGADGRTRAVAYVERRQGWFTVYNLNVATTQTYYAGGVWVHNPPTCPMPFSGSILIVDENLDPQLAAELESRGFDAVSAEMLFGEKGSRIQRPSSG